MRRAAVAIAGARSAVLRRVEAPLGLGSLMLAKVVAMVAFRTAS